MRTVPEAELDSDFEREYAWGDDQRHFLNPNRRKGSVLGFMFRFEAVIDCVKKYIPLGQRIGDFAAAQCNFSLTLAEAGYEVVAVDIKEEFLKYGKKKYTHGKFETVTANIIEYRTQNKFDGLILGEVIEHVAFPDQLLKSAAENLRSGGILIVTTPNGSEFGQPLPTYSQVTNIEELIPRQFHWGDHLFLYTETELRGLMQEAGFEVLECLKLNSSYVSQIKALRYIMPLSLIKWMDTKARRWKRKSMDSTNTMIMIGRRH